MAAILLMANVDGPFFHGFFTEITTDIPKSDGNCDVGYDLVKALMPKVETFNLTKGTGPGFRQRVLLLPSGDLT